VVSPFDFAFEPGFVSFAHGFDFHKLFALFFNPKMRTPFLFCLYDAPKYDTLDLVAKKKSGVLFVLLRDLGYYSSDS
jgi:hypothetical protein